MLTTYPIKTPRLSLRPFTLDDHDALYAIQSLPEVARYQYWEPSTPEDVAESLAKRVDYVALEAEGDRMLLAVELQDARTLIGDVSLTWVNQKSLQGEIGYTLHPRWQHQGFAQEAVTEMLRLGFEGLGLQRIIARCDVRNQGSIRLAERLGMRREAYFRQNEFIKGEWCDEYVYAMLAAEWQTCKEQQGYCSINKE